MPGLLDRQVQGRWEELPYVHVLTCILHSPVCSPVPSHTPWCTYVTFGFLS